MDQKRGDGLRATGVLLVRWVFRVTPPSIHGMVLTHAKRGLIQRTAGKARSLRVLVPTEELPPLEEPGMERNTKEP